MRSNGLRSVEILAPSLNDSDWDYNLESTSKATRQFGIRVGFRSIKGLRRQAIEKLIARRKENGVWRDLEDFLKDNLVDRLTLACLASAGAFAEFGLSRRAAIWSALRAPCFETLDEYERTYVFPKETPREIVEGDFAAMDTSLYMHPSELQKVHY